jgi:hypothetical protein
VIPLNRLPTRLLALALGTGPASLALADIPGADWMPADQVKQKLMAAGYTRITAFEADDGHWEGEGLKNGVKMPFHADPKTGAILTEKPDKSVGPPRRVRDASLCPAADRVDDRSGEPRPSGADEAADDVLHRVLAPQLPCQSRPTRLCATPRVRSGWGLNGRCRFVRHRVKLCEGPIPSSRVSAFDQPLGPSNGSKGLAPGDCV